MQIKVNNLETARLTGQRERLISLLLQGLSPGCGPFKFLGHYQDTELIPQFAVHWETGGLEVIVGRDLQELGLSFGGGDFSAASIELAKYLAQHDFSEQKVFVCEPGRAGPAFKSASTWLHFGRAQRTFSSGADLYCRFYGEALLAEEIEPQSALPLAEVETAGLEFELVLGSLRLSSEQVLALRVGSSIHCNLPINLDVQLKLAGDLFARARIRAFEPEMLLEIGEILNA